MGGDGDDGWPAARQGLARSSAEAERWFFVCGVARAGVAVVFGAIGLMGSALGGFFKGLL